MARHVLRRENTEAVRLINVCLWMMGREDQKLSGGIDGKWYEGGGK